MTVEENIYSNTPENAESIGWNRVAEYCIGDKSKPWMFHDYPNGKFYYLNDEERDEVLSGFQEVECIVGVCPTCNPPGEGSTSPPPSGDLAKSSGAES